MLPITHPASDLSPAFARQANRKLAPLSGTATGCEYASAVQLNQMSYDGAADSKRRA